MHARKSHLAFACFVMGATLAAQAATAEPAPTPNASRAATGDDEHQTWLGGRQWRRPISPRAVLGDGVRPKARKVAPATPRRAQATSRRDYRGKDPRAARYLALGLPEAKLEAFLRSGRSLTNWYNREHIGGKGLKAGGAFLVALGAASVLGAAILTGVIWGRECPHQSCDDDGSLAMINAFFGIPALVAGVLELGAGIPMVVVGNRRLRRWAKEGELDYAPIEELERRRDQARSKPKVSVSVLPYLTRGGGGFSLSLRF